MTCLHKILLTICLLQLSYSKVVATHSTQRITVHKRWKLQRTHLVKVNPHIGFMYGFEEQIHLLDLSKPDTLICTTEKDSVMRASYKITSNNIILTDPKDDVQYEISKLTGTELRLIMFSKKNKMAEKKEGNLIEFIFELDK